MKDYLVKALGFDDQIRAFAVSSTNLVEEARRRHGAWPSVSAALGRTLSVASMMGCQLKGDESLTIRIHGNGPMGPMIVDANGQGVVRGYVSNPEVHFQYSSGKLNVGMTVGTDGMLSVTKDLGLKDYFTGQVPLQTGEIGDDFTYYFTVSEQVPSAVGVGVLVDADNSVRAAGGFIVQVMPGATEETLTKLEKALGNIKPVSTMIDEGYTPEMILNAVFGDEVRILEKQDVRFECDCTKERFEQGIVSLGAEEIQAMIDEDNGAEAICHFCKEKHYFTASELEALLPVKK
ncbi:MAG TPA: Hsp33 family molecular chaperone HslO [Firmicutes bacterium]|nr:Hsp33 family molecular chaperone HslO [Bacillota bacterium]